MSDQEQEPHTNDEDLEFKIRGVGCLTLLCGGFLLLSMIRNPASPRREIFAVFFTMYGIGLFFWPDPSMVGWTKEGALNGWLDRVPPFWKIWLPLSLAATIVWMRFLR